MILRILHMMLRGDEVILKVILRGNMKIILILHMILRKMHMMLKGNIARDIVLSVLYFNCPSHRRRRSYKV